ncbi:hypothetical protein [Paracoccus marcusii]|uniref:hypothetical protein n=1 Tax=Paracoccus marcusii TaxID=59779 RepID=UPI003267F494
MQFGSVVKNPLTIIAIFASVTEVSGVYVLPNIEPANQTIYIIFLSLFPTLLVGLFFYTLHTNHTVLYAPSDWKDEKNFVHMTQMSREEKLKFVKDKLSGSDKENSEPAKEENDPKNKEKEADKRGSEKSEVNSDEVMRYMNAEEMAISKLKLETGIYFERDVKFTINKSRPIMVDGLGDSGDVKFIVDVKYIKSAGELKKLLPNRINQLKTAAEILAFEKKKVVIYLAIITDKAISIAESAEAVALIEYLSTSNDLDIRPRFYSTEDQNIKYKV